VEWTRLAEAVEQTGREHAARGQDASAAAYLLRAAHYYHVGERFLHPKDAAGLAAYQPRRRVLPRRGRPPGPTPSGTGGGAVRGQQPAGLARACRAAGPAPAMVFFDGFDITKEIQYFKGVPDLAARGIACLIVDGPGNGEAIRFRNLHLHHETERYARTAYEFLAGRKEIDPTRIAWGAQWD
jgi:hypothetical protein